MPATIAGSHLGLDTHANRPAANAAGQPAGALYSCSTHGLIYKTDLSTWSTYATLGSTPSGSITASGYTQSTGKLLGRSTASTGAIEELTVGSGLSLSGGTLSASGGGGGSGGSFSTLSGWTQLGTLDTSNVTDAAGYWHVKRACSSEIDGIYKAVPATPFTITVKIPQFIMAATQHPSIGIMLLDSGPTAIREFSYNFASGTNITCSLRRYTNRTSFSTSIDTTLTTVNTEWMAKFIPDLWLQLLVTSSSSVTFRYSLNGTIFNDVASIAAISPTITPAFYGLLVSDPVGPSTVEAWYDLPVIT